MAEFPEIENPEDETEFDYSDLFEPDQFLNWTAGTILARDGITQAIAEIEEVLGLEGPGHAEFVTQELKRDQELLDSSREHASALSGAIGYEVAGQLAHTVLVPLGGSVRAATGLGALASSGFFQEDVRDSRFDDILFGAIGGGAARKLVTALQKGGRAKSAAEDTIDQMSGQKLLAPPPRTPDPRMLDAALDVENAAQLAARSAPVAASKSLVPAGSKALTVRKIDAAKEKIRAAMRAASPQGYAYAKAALAKAQTFAAKAEAKVARLKAAAARSAEFKQAEELASAESAEAAASVMVKSIEDAIKSGFRSLKQLQPAKSTALTPAARVFPGPEATPLMPSALRSGLNQGPPSPTPIKVIKYKRTPAPPQGVSGPLPGKQAGFLNTDLQQTLSGVGAGAVVGGGLAGAVDPEAAPAGALLGAIGGGAVGRKVGQRLVSSADDARKKGLREASQEASDFQSMITNNQKVKNYTAEAINDTFSKARSVLDEFMGASMTRLEQLAPRLAVGLKQAEYNQHKLTQDWITEGDALMEKVGSLKLNDSQQRAFKIALLNSRESAKRALRGMGKDDSVIDEFAGLLDKVGVYVGSVGLGGGLRKNYFPRMVKDTSQFENIKEVKTYLAKLAKDKGVAELTGMEKEIALTQVINGALRRGGEDTAFGRAADQLQRRTNKVTSQNVDAYADLRETLHDYFQNIPMQIERRKFFQGQNVKVDDLGPNAENIDTVAKRLARALEGGDMTPEQVEEVTKLIRNRFGPGEQAPHRFWQNYKNLTYTGLLGSPLAAATQAGDLALSMHRNGIGNTAAAMVSGLAGRGKIAGLDKTTLLGIRNAATDFASNVGTRDLLNASLKYSGFQKMDEFGKNTFIQAAMLKNQQLDEGAFINRWKSIFDPDVAEGGDPARTKELFQKVKNFKQIDATNRDDVGFMLWNELSDVQPIALSALPERYLRHPNGRTAYMLQSFTLKLFDVMRKDIFQQAARGNYKQAAKAAGNLTGLFVMTNGGVDAAKNFVLNKDQALPELVQNNFLKMMGLNKYMFDSVGREGLGSTLLKTVAPPTAPIDALTDPKKALQQIPVGGKLFEAQIGD